MPQFGYTLMTELHDPRDLVRQARRAEEAEFDFVVISDHYLGWLETHGHSSFAWSVLGAVATHTERLGIATMVTAPIMRYHPAIIAQAAATMAVLSNGRFTLGLGAGERLNEHVVGQGWPTADVRHEMLREAIDVIRALWSGEWVDFRGRHFDVEDGKLFDLPDRPIDIFVAAGGAQSARIAAEKGDGVCAVEPMAAIVQAYTEAGGQPSQTWGQMALSWAGDREAALRMAHAKNRFGALGWKVMAELPNIVNFEAATRFVRPEDLAETVPHGPDPKDHAEGIGRYLDAGFENIAVVQVGDDVDGFFSFWRDELAPLVRG